MFDRFLTSHLPHHQKSSLPESNITNMSETASIISVRNSSRIVFIIIASLVLLHIFVRPYADQFSHHSPAPDVKDCDIFRGEWVPDVTTAPRYTNLTCRTMDDILNCMKFGRPDTDFMKWRWKPDDGCDLPPFDATVFLDLLRGKSMAFLGDSVGRNYMHSLMCLLSRVTTPVNVSRNPNPKFQRWWYPEHNFTLSCIWSPFLVKAIEVDPYHHTLGNPFNLYLDEPDDTWANTVEEFDYVIVLAGQWFFRPGMYYENNQLAGCNLCGDENITQLSIYYAYKHAFRTTFRTLKNMHNYTGTTFLATFTPQHFENGEWNKGGDCVRRSPFQRTGTRLDVFSLEFRKSQLEEFQTVAKENKQRFQLLDITEVLSLRPDGHPSRYGHLPNTTMYNDCVHWCLPGPMDNMNDFLLELLKREIMNK